MKVKKWWLAARNRVVEEYSEGSRGPQWAVELLLMMMKFPEKIT
jgi:hypothetical protein